jgi:hypothetical protein
MATKKTPVEPVKKSTVPARASGDADEGLKILAAALLREMGYFVEIGVPLDVDLYGESYRTHQATDLDVLALRFEGDFAETRVVVECKSGTGGAVEELLKIAAVARLLGAQRSWLAKTQIAENARQISETLGVLPIDDAELDLLLSGHGLRADAILAAEQEILAAERAHRARLSQEDEFKRLIKYCESDYWQREYWRNIHNLASQLARRVENGLDPADPSHRFLVFRVVMLMSISVLQLAARVAAWSAARPERGVTLFLFGGPSARREREVMFDLLRQAVPSEQLKDRSLDPPFTGDLVEVVSALIRNARSAADVPRLLQSAHRLLFVPVEADASAASELVEQWDPVTVKLAKDVTELALKAAGARSEFAAAFLNA